MKRFYLIFLPLFLSALVYSQVNIIREEIQFWDGVQSEWLKSGLVEKQYNDAGLLLVESHNFWLRDESRWEINQRFTFEYDANDNVILVNIESNSPFISPTGELFLYQEIRNEYNSVNILTKETITTFWQQGERYETVTNYNDQGCPINKISNGVLIVRYDCNQLGQIEEEFHIVLNEDAYHFQYEYDEYGNRHKVYVRRKVGGDWIFHYAYFDFMEPDGTSVYRYQYGAADPVIGPADYQTLVERLDNGQLLSGKVIEEDAITGEVFEYLNIERTFENGKIKNESIVATQKDFFEESEIETINIYDEENNLIRTQINSLRTNDFFNDQTTDIFEHTNDCRGLPTETIRRISASFGSFTNKQIYTYDQSVDCNYIDEKGALLFPNPSNGLVQIFSPKLNAPNTTIQIFDAMGRLVLQKDNCCDDKQVELQLQHFTNGVYYVHLRGAQIDQTEKLMILK